MREKKEILNNDGVEGNASPSVRQVPATLLQKVQEEINEINRARDEKIEQLDKIDESLALLYRVKQALSREII